MVSFAIFRGDPFEVPCKLSLKLTILSLEGRLANDAVYHTMDTCIISSALTVSLEETACS